jgi:hypothetical protein
MSTLVVAITYCAKLYFAMWYPIRSLMWSVDSYIAGGTQKLSAIGRPLDITCGSTCSLVLPGCARTMPAGRSCDLGQARQAAFRRPKWSMSMGRL